MKKSYNLRLCYTGVKRFLLSFFKRKNIAAGMISKEAEELKKCKYYTSLDGGFIRATFERIYTKTEFYRLADELEASGWRTES